jgi:hypothetical protein
MPAAAPAAVSIRFFMNISREITFLSVPHGDHQGHYRFSSPTIGRGSWGLATPIRSAGMRARTDMFKCSSDFHHSSVNPGGSCAYLPSRWFVFQPGFDGKIVQQILIGIFAGPCVIISDAMMIAIETRIRINRIQLKIIRQIMHHGPRITPSRTGYLSLWGETPGGGCCNVATYCLTNSRRKTRIYSGRITVFLGIIASSKMGGEAKLM